MFCIAFISLITSIGVMQSEPFQVKPVLQTHPLPTADRAPVLFRTTEQFRRHVSFPQKYPELQSQAFVPTLTPLLLLTVLQSTVATFTMLVIRTVLLDWQAVPFQFVPVTHSQALIPKFLPLEFGTDVQFRKQAVLFQKKPSLQRQASGPLF